VAINFEKGGSSANNLLSDAILCDLLRCVFGNPFRAADHKSVSGWNKTTVRSLSQGIYEDRAFDRLPILADALEEAGCTDAAMLGHCRGSGPHIRGCWVVDLILAKA
jgi:hypothetical protein